VTSAKKGAGSKSNAQPLSPHMVSDALRGGEKKSQSRMNPRGNSEDPVGGKGQVIQNE